MIFEPCDTNDLRVGDVIAVWWAPGRDTIIGLRSYDGQNAADGTNSAQFSALISARVYRMRGQAAGVFAWRIHC
jgi:hypothetical protein